jgi:hypothetical protein
MHCHKNRASIRMYGMKLKAIRGKFFNSCCDRAYNLFEAYVCLKLILSSFLYEKKNYTLTYVRNYVSIFLRQEQ